MANAQWLFWGAMLVGEGVAFVIFRGLADISQWVVNPSREFVMAVWHQRHRLVAVVVAMLVLATAMWLKDQSLCGKKTFVALAALMTLLTYSGYYNTQLMFRPLQHQAKFVSIDEARAYLEHSLPYMSFLGKNTLHTIDDIDMVVLETDQGAIAYANYYLLQPHVVKGGLVNGHEVVMTYCGLTNAALAISPEIGGERLDLGVMTQLENNLVMFDRNSCEPIQQIRGHMELHPEKGRLREWPTVRMPYSSFKRLYPNGKVFVNEIARFSGNPFLSVWDKITRNVIMFWGVGLQWTTDDPAFPTIKEFDGRLPRKTLVYGINVSDDYVAYTKQFVIDNTGTKPLNVEIGGRKIVVAYDPTYDTIGMFYNPMRGEITQVDVFGNSPSGKLSRVETVKNAVFWFIWAHFFPQTDVNRS